MPGSMVPVIILLFALLPGETATKLASSGSEKASPPPPPPQETSDRADINTATHAPALRVVDRPRSVVVTSIPTLPSGSVLPGLLPRLTRESPKPNRCGCAYLFECFIRHRAAPARISISPYRLLPWEPRVGCPRSRHRQPGDTGSIIRNFNRHLPGPYVIAFKVVRQNSSKYPPQKGSIRISLPAPGSRPCSRFDWFRKFTLTYTGFNRITHMS